MPGKKGGKPGHHKSYKGPWPEQHTAIPGRKPQGGPGREKTHSEGAPHQTQVHKIPPQTPK
jgi:hypothetical protein